jgi:hypothetical protein
MSLIAKEFALDIILTNHTLAGTVWVAAASYAPAKNGPLVGRSIQFCTFRKIRNLESGHTGNWHHVPSKAMRPLDLRQERD